MRPIVAADTCRLSYPHAAWATTSFDATDVVQANAALAYERLTNRKISEQTGSID
jgi:hypothetical protein